MNITKKGLLLFSSMKNVLEFRTLMCILANTQQDGSCHVIQKDLAKLMGVHRQMVNRSIKSLTNLNIFSIEKKGTKRIYHINPEYCRTNNNYHELQTNYENYKVEA